MNVFSSIFADGMTVGAYLLGGLISLICGAIAAVCALKICRASKSFFISLTVLPLAVHTVILMVNGSIGTGIAVAGAFSLIRFRSFPGRARDILLIFISMTAGLACATGYVAVALIFTVIACVALMLASKIKISSDKEMKMKITVPENLNFTGAFDDIFEKYTKKADLLTVKNSNMGSLYKLTYRIELKDENDVRGFIDDLRTRNGNLEIVIFKAEEEDGL